jgi:hypothetical protein
LKLENALEWSLLNNRGGVECRAAARGGAGVRGGAGCRAAARGGTGVRGIARCRAQLREAPESRAVTTTAEERVTPAPGSRVGGLVVLIKYRFQAPTCEVNIWNNHVFTSSTKLLPLF